MARRSGVAREQGWLRGLEHMVPQRPAASRRDLQTFETRLEAAAEAWGSLWQGGLAHEATRSIPMSLGLSSVRF